MAARAPTVAFVVLLVCSLPAGVGALEPAQPATPAGTTAPTGELVASPSEPLGSVGASTGSRDVFDRTTVLRHRPADTDVFETETTFHVPDAVTQFEIELQQGASVESVTGLERTSERTYEWTGATDEPTIRYTMPADRRGGSYGTRTSETGYTFVDTGDWGIVPVPSLNVSLRRTDPVGIEETVTVDGPGATGGDIAVFGPVTTHERATDGGTIRLVVPEAARLEESPDAILTALADARDRLAVGMRRDEVVVIAAPTEADWGPRGIQYGRADAWVVADAELDEPNPAWLHEYVHVRQRFSSAATDTTPKTAWLVEAQADYYAGLLAFERGDTDFGDFSDLLERGERSPYADGVLVDRSTWNDDRTHYVKGALVYGELDRRLRLATDGDRTLADVFRSLNAQEDRITEADFLRTLEEYGGVDVRVAAERYTRTEATPEMWSRSQQSAAFEQPVAAFEYGVGSEPLEVAGQEWPHWNASGTAGTAGESGGVIAVPAGEPVSLPVTVENVGSRNGTYDATLQVDGRPVDARQGRLAAGEEAQHRLSWTPAEPGEYAVRVGSERLTAVVRSAASVTVTDLHVSAERVEPGEPVTATATVEAAGERPATAVIAFRTAEGVVAERPVALRAGDSTTIEAELRFDDPGRYQIAVGDRTTTARVGSGPTAALETVSGFGIPATLVAVAMLLIVAIRARQY
ncbi:CARDB domain-containing protein [Haloarchaeobius amylolyticus]|uniref:CARDB domain-containing protein n=1 Tax=Haloarchaeobius amylolyticus TaxID=1198296 RepID=A0ABD6BJU0_9EURY